MRTLVRWKNGELSSEEAMQELGDAMEERLAKHQPIDDLQKAINEILGMDEEPGKRDRKAESVFERSVRRR